MEIGYSSFVAVGPTSPLPVPFDFAVRRETGIAVADLKAPRKINNEVLITKHFEMFLAAANSAMLTVLYYCRYSMYSVEIPLR